MKKILLTVSLLWAALINTSAFADAAAMSADAATQIAASSTAVETYSKAILGVLVIIAIAGILFGLTHKAR